MSFTDQKPFTVTPSDLAQPWSGGAPGEFLRCGLCGYRFALGDTARWMFTNNLPDGWGNPFLCVDCDTPDSKANWIQHHKDWKKAQEKFWFFCKFK